MTSFKRKLALGLAVGVAAIAASAAKTSGDVPGAKPAISTHQTAPTRFVDINGARIAYRRFGKRGGIPLVFLQHFTGNMDNWDPKVTDGFAQKREVILFDSVGVAGSTGEVPTSVEGMARSAISFLEALGVQKADVLGFSLGSLIAQEVTIERPDLVHRVILVGSGPRGGAGMASLTPEFQGFLAKKHDAPDEVLLDVFFTQSESSQAAGRALLTRLRARKVNRDVDANDKVAPAQIAAFAAWGTPHANSSAYLKTIKQPVLVIGGSNDLVHYTVNSFTLQQNIPNAELIIYPDSNHGPIYQYPDLFLKHATLFLDAAR